MDLESQRINDIHEISGILDSLQATIETEPNSRVRKAYLKQLSQLRDSLGFYHPAHKHHFLGKIAAWVMKRLTGERYRALVQSTHAKIQELKHEYLTASQTAQATHLASLNAGFLQSHGGQILSNEEASASYVNNPTAGFHPNSPPAYYSTIGPNNSTYVLNIPSAYGTPGPSTGQSSSQAYGQGPMQGQYPGFPGLTTIPYPQPIYQPNQQPQGQYYQSGQGQYGQGYSF